MKHLNLLDPVLVNQIHSRLSPYHYRTCVCCLPSPRVPAVHMPSGMRLTTGPGDVWCSWRGRAGTWGTSSIPCRSASLSVENTTGHLVRHLFRYAFDSRAPGKTFISACVCYQGTWWDIYFGMRLLSGHMVRHLFLYAFDSRAPGKTFISACVCYQGTW